MPGSELDRRSRCHRRVDPLVEMDLMARVEEDPEERVTEASVDDLMEGPARLPDSQRARTTRPPPRSRGPPAARCSPRCRRGARSASSTTNPARQFNAPQMPKATVKRSPRSIRRSPGLSRPSEARGPLVSMRWQESGIPFQPRSRTASCSVIPGRSPNSSCLTPCEVWQAAYSKSRQLLDLVDHPEPSGGVDHYVGGVLDSASAAGDAAAARRR